MGVLRVSLYNQCIAEGEGPSLVKVWEVLSLLTEEFNSFR